VSEAIESVNPFSSENCAYQAVNSIVNIFNGDAGALAAVTMIASVALDATPLAPVGIALGALSAAASAYAAGEDAGKGEALQAALDGLSSVLGGAAAAERLLGELESLAPTLAGESLPEQRRALADLLDKMGYGAEATALLHELCDA
jgi:hypothetical protein